MFVEVQAICNLFQTIHNIWLQQCGKRGGCLYATTSNDYICDFKQSALHRVYLNGERCKEGCNKD